MRDVDILIVGGGLTGGMLALALQKTGYKFLLLEAYPFKDKDDKTLDARTLALAPATINILKALDIFPAIAADLTPINTIHISQKSYFGSSLLKNTDPLGYVIEMHILQRALFNALDKKNILEEAKITHLHASKATITHKDNVFEINTKIFIGADGTDSPLRKLAGFKAEDKYYDHVALVANIKLQRHHKNYAYERFTKAGPLALLPLQNNNVALVWSLKQQQAKQMLTLSKQEFLQALQREFGYRLGLFTDTGKRAIFPLRQVIMQTSAVWPYIFIGNAAHTIHPVAGQGFNLGIRDVALLAEYIIKFGINENMLKNYQHDRASDQNNIIKATDLLIKLFGNKIPGFGHLRGMGIFAFDNLAFLKNIITHYAKGYSGIISDLVCGLPLEIKNEQRI